MRKMTALHRRSLTGILSAALLFSCGFCGVYADELQTMDTEQGLEESAYPEDVQEDNIYWDETDLGQAEGVDDSFLTKTVAGELPDPAYIGLIEEMDEDTLHLEASNIRTQLDAATELQLDTAVTVDPSAPRFYSFQAQEKAVYEFYTLSSNNTDDPLLRIFDAEGNLLRENDDYAINQDPEYDSVHFLEAQVYDASVRITIEENQTIYVMAYVYTESSSFKLHAEKLSAEEADPDAYNVSGNSADAFALWPLSPDYQDVEVNEPVTLKVGWSTVGKEQPAFVWTIDGVTAGETSDTLTFTPAEEFHLYEISVSAPAEEQTEPVKFAVQTVHAHIYSGWKTERAATALEEGIEYRECLVCDKRLTRSVAKLSPYIKLNVSGKLPMQTGQKTSKVKVELQKGDYITGWTSSNKKVVTVSTSGTLKAKKKTGKATITVTTAAGQTASFVVAVQKKKVAAKKITVAAKNITLTKGQKFDLQTAVQPLTTQYKVRYKLSRKGIVKVSKGVITAKKKGKTTITVQSGKKKVKVKVTVQ